jgi:hypothetical protein
MPHQCPTVEVRQTAFHLVNTPVRLPMVEGMAAMIPAWDNPAVPLLGLSFTDGLVLETEVLRPRNTQIVLDYIRRYMRNCKLTFTVVYGKYFTSEWQQ